jgi:simple sugar transport system permease protein
MYSTPLIYTALGGTISENGGVVNIGLEGMMSFGAFMAAAIGFYSGNPWIGFLAGGLAGMSLALLHAIATVTFRADHVVSGIALNFLGPGLALFLSRLMFAGATMTRPLDLTNKIPQPLRNFFAEGNGPFQRNGFFGIIFNQYATVYLVFILVALVWFVLYRTRFGLRLRSVGEHPEAADSLGINVFRMKYIAVLLSGAMAGFGGAAMSIAVVSRFSPTLISGQGFIALAAMIFGKWKPQGAMLASLMFGFAQGLAIYLGNPRVGVDVPGEILSMIPYILTLILLIFQGKLLGRTVGPRALGKPFYKS